MRTNQEKESLEIDEDLGFKEASKMTKCLMEGPNSQEQKLAKINEARPGMVLRERYRHFSSDTTEKTSVKLTKTKRTNFQEVRPSVTRPSLEGPVAKTLFQQQANIELSSALQDSIKVFSGWGNMSHGDRVPPVSLL